MHLSDPGVVGEQSVMTDAVEATGQDMQEKTADELVGVQSHGLVAIGFFGAIVFPLEADTMLITGDQTAVGDGDTMGIAGQVSEYGLGSGKRLLGIDDPVDLA